MEAVIYAAYGAAVAHGNGHPIGNVPVELLRNFKRNGLFAFGKGGVYAGVSIIIAVFIYRRAGKLERFAVIALHAYLRAEYHKLSHLALRRALRHEYNGLNAHARRVARKGACGVAGGGTGYGIVSKLQRLSHGHGACPVLERGCGVEPIVLDIERLYAKLRTQLIGRIERGPANAQKTRKVPRLHRHKRRIAEH